MNTRVLTHSDLPGIKLLKRGKVRDVYELGDKLLIVASDRISAFDVVMEDPIPDKGKVLTNISLFWFSRLDSIVANHVLSSDPAAYPEECSAFLEQLAGRSMLVRKAEPLPVECIVRGYLAGADFYAFDQGGRRRPR